MSRSHKIRLLAFTALWLISLGGNAYLYHRYYQLNDVAGKEYELLGKLRSENYELKLENSQYDLKNFICSAPYEVS